MYAIKDSLFYACVLILLIIPNLIPIYIYIPTFQLLFIQT